MWLLSTGRVASHLEIFLRAKMCSFPAWFSQQPLSWREPRGDSVAELLELPPWREAERPPGVTLAQECGSLPPESRLALPIIWLFKPPPSIPVQILSLLQEGFSRHWLPIPLDRTRPVAQYVEQGRQFYIHTVRVSEFCIGLLVFQRLSVNSTFVLSDRVLAYLTDTQCKRVGTQCWVFGWVICYHLKPLMSVDFLSSFLTLH